jgi:2-succinyl-6-hydroxy-2,4-cyclohexadiene-1-carboxylate synthase
MTPSASHDTHPGPSPIVRLHAETTGTGARLVLAHGFTQTGRVWGPMADDLARDHEVVSVDLPGHGGSSAVRADLDTGARLLVEVGGSGIYLGYSMGARFCLHAALSFPDRVRSLILISGTAGIEDDSLRRDRVAADEALATELDPRLETGPGPDDQERLDSFLLRWLDLPLFAGIPEDAVGLDQRRANTTAGLASSLRLAGTGTQRPLWDQLPGLSMPVLVITGERDAKFTALGARLADTIGENAVHAVVPGVGHTAHLEDPDGVTALVRSHLAVASGSEPRPRAP